MPARSLLAFSWLALRRSFEETFDDTSAAEESIKLDLYLPSGRVFGSTTSHYNFTFWANGEMGRDEGEVGAIGIDNFDPEYVHLKVNAMVMPGQPSSVDVLRIKLSEVVAWSVG